jgi:hypothetical protein
VSRLRSTPLAEPEPMSEVVPAMTCRSSPHCMAEVLLLPGDVDLGPLGIAADAYAPLVTVVVAVGGVGARLGLGVGDVVVGVDEARRDRRRLGQRDHRAATAAA